MKGWIGVKEQGLLKKNWGRYLKRYWMVYAMLIPGLLYIIVFK